MSAPAASANKKPRPQYPPWVDVARYTVLHYVRGPLYGALFCKYVFGPYIFRPLAEWFGTVDLAELLPAALMDWFGTTPAPAEGSNIRDKFFGVGVLLAVHALMYWGMNVFSYMCIQKGWFKEYQLLRTKRMIPSKELIRATLVDKAVGQFIISPLALSLMGVYFWHFPPILSLQGKVLPQPDIPLLEMAFHISAAQLFNECGFAFFHRLVHFPSLYWIHKQHHSYVGTVGFSAEYASPIEQATANYPPTILYQSLFPRYITWEIAITWLIMRFWETYEAHSGFCFEDTFFAKYLGLGYSQVAKFHDWHHTDNRGNYGYPWSDWLFGSMDTYVEGELNKEKEKKIKST